MKLLLPFFAIIFFSVAFGQSPKKLNKQLRAQLALDRHKQDSAYSVFQKDETYLNNLRSDIYQKVRGPLADAESRARKSVNAFQRTWTNLKTLGIDPQTLVSDSALLKYPYKSSRDVLKPLKAAWDNFLSFDFEKRDGSDLGQYKVKEQNERLHELISSYQDAFSSSQHQIREQREYITRLEEFKLSLDPLIALYEDLIKRADKAYQILAAKSDELKANYRLKGPKGFPEAYRRVFPDVHDVRLKLQDLEIKEMGSQWTDNVAGMMDPEPKSEPYLVSNQEPVIYEVVEEPASFPGGLDSLKKYLKQHIYYPEIAKDLGIFGKVFLRFVVSDKGEISDVKIQRGVPDCPECDQEAIRVIKAMPNWIPAKNNGKAVHSYFNLPILFKMN
jgi:TonB family protein